MRNNDNNNWLNTSLKTDPEVAIPEITSLIQDRYQALNRRSAIVGLSGGLDSSLTAALTAKSLGKDLVKLYYLPERDSKPIHRQHAKILAEHLDLDLDILNISPALKALRVYQLLPLRFIPTKKLKARAVEYGRNKFLTLTQGEFLSTRLAATGGSWVARGNAYASAKHRMRMVALYLKAESTRAIVIGAANKTEWMTGTFTQFGCDHCADVMPLLHLYRSQLIQIAEYLNLPQEILSKKADPDVIPGLDDKGALLGSFEEADKILWGLEHGIPLEKIENEFGKAQVEYIQTLVTNSAYYRETPYSLL